MKVQTWHFILFMNGNILHQNRHNKDFFLPSNHSSAPTPQHTNTHSYTLAPWGDTVSGLHPWWLERMHPSSTNFKPSSERQTATGHTVWQRDGWKEAKINTPSTLPHPLPHICTQVQRWGWGGNEKGGMNRWEKTKKKGKDGWMELAFIRQNLLPCLWVTACHRDVFFLSLSRRHTNTQMNQSWHSLMTHCHLCGVSHVIAAESQNTQTHTQDVPCGP